MTAALVDIATAVASDLAAGHGAGRISQALAVQRVYIPRFYPPDQAAGAWQVLVSAAGEEQERLGRNEIAVTYHIEIGICGKLADVLVATVDTALQAVQEMADLFFDYGLSSNDAVWIRNQVYAWPDRERLAQDGVLFALWEAEFEGTRKRAG